jgi:hypothetical protein
VLAIRRESSPSASQAKPGQFNEATTQSETLLPDLQ